MYQPPLNPMSNKPSCGGMKAVSRMSLIPKLKCKQRGLRLAKLSGSGDTAQAMLSHPRGSSGDSLSWSLRAEHSAQGTAPTQLMWATLQSPSPHLIHRLAFMEVLL